MNTATAAYCAAGALISARITNTGIMQILSMESLFGKFIFDLSNQIIVKRFCDINFYKAARGELSFG